MAVALFNKKLYSSCQQLVAESCHSCHSKELQMRQFKECLRMFNNSLMVMLGKRQSLTTYRVIFILL
jgi:hypothetical protein